MSRRLLTRSTSVFIAVISLFVCVCGKNARWSSEKLSRRAKRWTISERGAGDSSSDNNNLSDSSVDTKVRQTSSAVLLRSGKSAARRIDFETGLVVDEKLVPEAAPVLVTSAQVVQLDGERSTGFAYSTFSITPTTTFVADAPRLESHSSIAPKFPENRIATAQPSFGGNLQAAVGGGIFYPTSTFSSSSHTFKTDITPTTERWNQDHSENLSNHFNSTTDENFFMDSLTKAVTSLASFTAEALSSQEGFQSSSSTFEMTDSTQSHEFNSTLASSFYQNEPTSFTSYDLLGKNGSTNARSNNACQYLSCQHGSTCLVKNEMEWCKCGWQHSGLECESALPLYFAYCLIGCIVTIVILFLINVALCSRLMNRRRKSSSTSLEKQLNPIEAFNKPDSNAVYAEPGAYFGCTGQVISRTLPRPKLQLMETFDDSYRRSCSPAAISNSRDREEASLSAFTFNDRVPSAASNGAAIYSTFKKSPEAVHRLANEP